MVYYCTNSQVEQVRRSLSFAIFFVYCTYLVALLFSKILKDEQVTSIHFLRKRRICKNMLMMLPTKPSSSRSSRCWLARPLLT